MARMTGAPVSVRRRKRPFALVILVTLMLFKSVLLILLVFGGLTRSDSVIFEALQFRGAVAAVQDVTVVLVGILIVAGVLLVSTLGLLACKRVGWLLAMVTTGLFVAVDILGFVTGQVNYLWMALNIVTVFYLNQREVREIVGATSTGGFDPSPASEVA